MFQNLSQAEIRVDNKFIFVRSSKSRFENEFYYAMNAFHGA